MPPSTRKQVVRTTATATPGSYRRQIGMFTVIWKPPAPQYLVRTGDLSHLFGENDQETLLLAELRQSAPEGVSVRPNWMYGRCTTLIVSAKNDGVWMRLQQAIEPWLDGVDPRPLEVKIDRFGPYQLHMRCNRPLREADFTWIWHFIPGVRIAVSRECPTLYVLTPEFGSNVFALMEEVAACLHMIESP